MYRWCSSSLWSSGKKQKRIFELLKQLISRLCCAAVVVFVVAVLLLCGDRLVLTYCLFCFCCSMLCFESFLFLSRFPPELENRALEARACKVITGKRRSWKRHADISSFHIHADESVSTYIYKYIDESVWVTAYVHTHMKVCIFKLFGPLSRFASPTQPLALFLFLLLSVSLSLLSSGF